MKNNRKSIWVQIFLANKYMNEFLKQSPLKTYGLNPYDYFLLLALRTFEDCNFYEINKHFPIDGKSLHIKINSFVENGLMERTFEDSGASKINLTDEARKILREIFLTNIEDTEEYFEPEELLNLHTALFSFNEKMRKILEMELSENFKAKENLDLL